MIEAHQGDRFRDKTTGNVYRIKKVVENMVIMERVNGTSQVLTELNGLGLFYQRELKKDEDQG